MLEFNLAPQQLIGEQAPQPGHQAASPALRTGLRAAPGPYQPGNHRQARERRRVHQQRAPVTQFDAMPQNFGEVVALFDQRREALIRSHLWSHVHLVAFEPGRIEFRTQEAAPRDLANRLGQLLGEWTGTRWVVAVSQAAA